MIIHVYGKSTRTLGSEKAIHAYADEKPKGFHPHGNIGSRSRLLRSFLAAKLCGPFFIVPNLFASRSYEHFLTNLFLTHFLLMEIFILREPMTAVVT